MTRLTYALADGVVLVVARPRGEFLDDATEVSFCAGAGALPESLRMELDAGIPITFAGPDSELGRIVEGILGTRVTDRPVNAPVAPRGQTPQEALQRAVDDDRRGNYNH